MNSSTPTSKIAVLGEALVDQFPDRSVLGGAPFNVARNLAAFGLRPLLVSSVGQDTLGEQIRRECVHFGIDPQGLQVDPNHPTGVVNVHMKGTQHEFEILEDQAWDHLDEAQALRVVTTQKPQLVYFGTLIQRNAVSRQTINSVLRSTGQAVRFLDLNFRAGNDNQVLSAISLLHADIVKVNDEELLLLLHWFVRSSMPAPEPGSSAERSAVAQLMSQFDLQRLIVTRGADGWACFDRYGSVLQGPAPAVSVVDTVGAGDAFSSVVILGHVSAWPMALSLQRAAEFASEVCSLRGATDISLALYARTKQRWGMA